MRWGLADLKSLPQRLILTLKPMHCLCLLGHKGRHSFAPPELAEALAVGDLLAAASSTGAVAPARTTVPHLPVGVLPTKKGASRTSDLALARVCSFRHPWCTGEDCADPVDS